MSKPSFSNAALQSLQTLLDWLLDQHQAFPTLDADLQAGVLSMVLEEKGEYIIHAHAPSQQIWVASPLSGAHYFQYHESEHGESEHAANESLFKNAAGTPLQSWLEAELTHFYTAR